MTTRTALKINAKTKPPLHPSDQWISIGLGNYYKGKWNHITMSGHGVYVMFDGTVYEGDFEDGLFHGAGTIHYLSEGRLEGIWQKGKCLERNYIFGDGLRYQPDNWLYCQISDRRFVIEHINGLEPAAKSPITNHQPTIEILKGDYDAGDGFYRPLTNTVHNYWTNALIRVPTTKCGKWIMENCRRGGDKVVDFRSGPNENWYKTRENVLSDTDNLPSEQIVYNNQSIMADIISVPWSMFDLFLQDKSTARHQSASSTTDDRFSSSTGCRPNYCRNTVLVARGERTRFPCAAREDVHGNERNESLLRSTTYVHDWTRGPYSE